MLDTIRRDAHHLTHGVPCPTSAVLPLTTPEALVTDGGFLVARGQVTVVLRRRTDLPPAAQVADIDEALTHARASKASAREAGDQEQVDTFQAYIDSLLDQRLARRP